MSFAEALLSASKGKEDKPLSFDERRNLILAEIAVSLKATVPQGSSIDEGTLSSLISSLAHNGDYSTQYVARELLKRFEIRERK